MSLATRLLSAETMRAHRARWYVWAGNEKIPHTAQMRGLWGWDATCSCGEWESRTGGATRSAVEEMLLDHRLDAQWGARS